MSAIVPVDEQFERLKDPSKLPGAERGHVHLSVLNAAASAPGELVLQDEGRRPCDPPRARGALQASVIAALRTVHDPEIPLNLYDLGLIYSAEVADDGSVSIAMTLTAPGCPVAGSLVREVHERVRSVDGALRVRTELVWDPPWSRERMSEAAQLELGLL